MGSSQKDKIFKQIKTLFPINYNKNQLADFLHFFFDVLNKIVVHKDAARILNNSNKNKPEDLIKKFSKLPEEVQDPYTVSKEIVANFFLNIPRWRSPQLQYNVGASVNTIASAIYSLALDENIYNINDGLAGNSLLAEQSVANILANLAGINKKVVGFFTFGGTATNYYAVKIGLKKACPESGKIGLPKNIKLAITKDSHFSHLVSADWLGVGTDNAIVIETNLDRTSNLEDAENKLRKAFDDGNIVPSIIINGGTTYGHVIDDILTYVKLRDRLVKDYSLPYIPHLHVDSVIGWAWLMFHGYDFDKNILGIEAEALEKICRQYNKIAQLKFADSWGVDFHKGVGACPVDCSIVMINDIKDINLISKKEGANIDMHQLATEFSLNSPADYTLETSRSGGPALAALAVLHTLGQAGFQRNLANLIEQTLYMRKLLAKHDDIHVCHESSSLGYVTMLRFYPPELKNDPRKQGELDSDSKNNIDFINQVNKYMKNFFTWDNQNRIQKGLGVEYSFSSGYLILNSGAKISGAKLYPVSPHFNRDYANQAIKTIVKQKKIFDHQIWKTNH